MGAFDSFASGLDEAPKASVTISPIEKPSKNIKSAADLNNPSGYGYNGKTWKAYETPEEGVNETLSAIERKINTKGINTPETLAGHWVTGDATQNPQNGNYAKNIRKELLNSGIKLNEDNTIPNSPDAIQAVTKAIIKNETAKEHQDKFLNVFNKRELNDDEGFLKALQTGSLSEKPTEKVTPTEQITKTEKPSDTNKLNAYVAGFGGAISEGAGALEQLVGKGVGLVNPELGQKIERHALEQIEKTKKITQPYIEANPITGAIGQVSGLIANPVNKLIPGFGGPAQTVLGGVAKGAGQGAVANILTTPVTDENKSFLTEKLKQGLVGGVAGGVVGGIAKTATSLAQPFENQLSKVSQDNVKILRDAGVPIDVAQATGSQFLNRTKAALSDNPFTAGKESEFIATQQSAYNKAIAKTMGEDANAITPDVLQNAKSRLGEIYDDLYNKYGSKVSGQIYKDLDAIRNESQMVLPASEQPIIKNIVDDIINKASANRSTLTGEQYQAQKRILDRLIAQNSNISPYATEIKETLLAGLKKSIKDPNDITLLQQTNKQYGNMKKIEDVVLKDTQGNVSPALLSNSLATKAKRNAIYSEDAQLANLARAGKDILQNKTPNSGTIARLSAQAAPALVGGAAYGLYEGDIQSAAKGAALGYAAPKLAQAILRNPKTAKYLEEGVSNKTLRSMLELPKKVGEVVPPYASKPGVAGAAALRELINLRNQGQ